MVETTQLYLIRHGETEWSLSGQHTGLTDIPLTEHGREQARHLHRWLSAVQFDAVFCSPLTRARQTAELAGLQSATATEDLAEIDYGDYEGLTSEQIHRDKPKWTVWTGELPNGETLHHAQSRVHRVIQRACQFEGNVALVAHGHILRILAVTWLGLPVVDGRLLMLDAGSLSLLSHEHGQRTIRSWNRTADSQQLT